MPPILRLHLVDVEEDAELTQDPKALVEKARRSGGDDKSMTFGAKQFFHAKTVRPLTVDLSRGAFFCLFPLVRSRLICMTLMMMLGVKVPVRVNRELRQSPEHGSTRHVEIDISGVPELQYRTADNLSICPRAPDDIVQALVCASCLPCMPDGAGVLLFHCGGVAAEASPRFSPRFCL